MGVQLRSLALLACLAACQPPMRVAQATRAMVACSVVPAGCFAATPRCAGAPDCPCPVVSACFCPRVCGVVRIDATYRLWQPSPEQCAC